MSKTRQLDKHPDYCSKCYLEYKLRCPICLKFKIKRHCKLYHNPSSLHWHLRNGHVDYVDSKFSTNDAINALNGIAWALQHGMLEEN